jgi:hypothetical protein
MICTFIFVLTMAASVAAQNFQARLVGTITDQTDAAIPGATVTVINIGTKQSFTAATSEQGAFVFSNLTPGNYQVSVRTSVSKKRRGNLLGSFQRHEHRQLPFACAPD